jgi:hypothetical protein
MRELRYAALLHDFGKVGVREEVLIKSKKLTFVQCERVAGRFDLIRCTLELKHERKRSALWQAGGEARSAITALEAELNEELAQLERFRSVVEEANEPTVHAEQMDSMLFEIASSTFRRPDGKFASYLEPEELHYLRIPRGSLDERERLEIESHANQTFQFLSGIPWTDDLKDIAVYAASHHEMLDGSGYPKHLRGLSVPVQTRMLTIADIFDALTAADRPYKPALSAERALDIIQADVKAGRLDGEIARVMIDSGVFTRILEEDWHQF